jgi:hypothetical protein
VKISKRDLAIFLTIDFLLAASIVVMVLLKG